MMSQNKGKIKSFEIPFNSNYHRDQYNITITINLSEESDLSEEDVIAFTEENYVLSVEASVQNLRTNALYQFTDKRIKQAFNYLLGNVKYNVIHDFDLEPIYQLIVEEITD